ncbi:MAG: glyoxalase/bleomycin resistance/dioxygenase family protein [Nitrospirales bacterium]|nr:glyoxalase/bleomycin resistance/dioxygenase family protein [Nitrospirales bacterium]
MNKQSAVNFPGSSRVHIALAVMDLERSRTFYETLLGVPPTKERPGYVKFEPQNPSVNLTLNEVDETNNTRQPTMHYGVQVKTPQAVQEAITRFSEAGLKTLVEKNTTCCYAVQDKVWVADPEGNQWEIFVVLEADADFQKDNGSSCCTPNFVQASSATCC